MSGATRRPSIGPRDRKPLRVELAFDPFSPEFQADPYPTTAGCGINPVLCVSLAGVELWLVTRYAEAVAVLRGLRALPLTL